MRGFARRPSGWRRQSGVGSCESPHDVTETTPLVRERSPMPFESSEKAKQLQARLKSFMDAHVYPSERRFYEELRAEDRWRALPVIEELKRKARAEGLWNLFLPESERGAGLTNLEYAPLCEIMGRVP